MAGQPEQQPQTTAMASVLPNIATPSASHAGFAIRPGCPQDVRSICELAAPLSEERILVAKEMVGYFEAIQEFVVAVDTGGRVVGCGALHVMWEDLAEVRTLATATDWRGQGVGHALLEVLLSRARTLGIARVFCLTFEVEFFARHGFEVIEGTPVDPEVYAELLRSTDDGIAEFLDLARVKPNTLGNTRMIKSLGNK